MREMQKTDDQADDEEGYKAGQHGNNSSSSNESSAEIGSCNNSHAEFNINHLIHTVRDLPRPWCGPCSRSRRLTSADEQAFCWHIPRRVSGMNLQLPPDSNDQALKSPSARPRPPHARPNCAVLAALLISSPAAV
jgi:hypothetical protein